MQKFFQQPLFAKAFQSSMMRSEILVVFHVRFL
jgi:hypothetical protein